LLISFGLKQASALLPDLINEAEKENLTPRQFLLTVLEAELNARNEKKRKRNYAGAHFPPNVRSIDEFDTSELDGGITPHPDSPAERTQLDRCGKQRPFLRTSRTWEDHAGSWFGARGHQCRIQRML
jgi:hypothetical protein